MMLTKIKVKRKRRIFGTVLLMYVGSYCVLSFFGRYEAFGIGISGVKSYMWAPLGFVTQAENSWMPGETCPDWRYPLCHAYGPLFFADQRLWHTQEKIHDGHYPINRTLENAFDEALKTQQVK